MDPSENTNYSPPVDKSLHCILNGNKTCTLGNLIGEGSFASVYDIVDRPDVAIKVFKFNNDPSSLLQIEQNIGEIFSHFKDNIGITSFYPTGLNWKDISDGRRGYLLTRGEGSLKKYFCTKTRRISWNKWF